MKNILVKLIALIIFVAYSFQEVRAYDFEVDGIYYNILSMADLEVEVTYKSLDQTPTPSSYIGSYNSYDNKSPYKGKIVIPEKVNYSNKTFEVVSIGENAFGSIPSYDNIWISGLGWHDEWSYGKACNIEEVIMPTSVREIKNKAFCNCSKLIEITFPKNLEIIGDQAFWHSNLSNIVNWGKTYEIGEEAFYQTSLENIILPSSLTKIGASAFKQTKARKLIIGDGVKDIGSSTFYNNINLIEVFCLPHVKPNGLNSNSFVGSHPALEIYVPNREYYGFGREYIEILKSHFIYNGRAHQIEWTNNLKAYKCEIPERECVTKESNAGEHIQYLAATYSNGVDFTVEIPYKYTINKAPMTLTVNNVQREYGEPNPAFSCNIIGWVNGENEQTIGITPSFECEATQRSNVGDYRILASLEAPNYEITYQYGTLSILKAQLTAYVINSTKIYGSPNPQFDLSFSGLKNDETSPSWEVQPTFYTTATEKSSAGGYEVTASNGIATNYNISSYTPGVLSITKKDLTAKANDCERLYGEDNPEFTLSFIGFVNEDSETNFTSTPTAECMASINSNAGTYPITVNGGSSKNYNFIYQDGTLTVNPLTVGFKDVYNSVTFDDMSVSVTEDFFYYVPEIFGPYNEEDFWLELMALDKDNRYPSQHVTTVSGGEYAGDYINYSTFMLGAGKYIFNLTSKGTNPNVVANPSRAYVTVNRASTNLNWNASTPIRVKVGEKVDLGITYQADLWCSFNTEYDKELISLSSEGATTRNPHWYATGLKEGRTYLEFSIDCMPNDFGFYDFSDSSTLYKEIIVSGYYEDGIEEVPTESDGTLIVYNLHGVRMNVSTRDELNNLAPGLYIINGKKEFIR